MRQHDEKVPQGTLLPEQGPGAPHHEILSSRRLPPALHTSKLSATWPPVPAARQTLPSPPLRPARVDLGPLPSRALLPSTRRDQLARTVVRGSQSPRSDGPYGLPRGLRATRSVLLGPKVVGVVVLCWFVLGALGVIDNTSRLCIVSADCGVDFAAASCDSFHLHFYF